MRVYVELSQDVDAVSWGEKHARGEAADATPYGLHRLEDFGHRVRFAPPVRSRVIQRVGNAASARLWGLQPARILATSTDLAARSADVVLCMDERTGLPASLWHGSTPVVTGIAWLDDPAGLSPVQRRVARWGMDRAAGVFVECAPMVGALVDGFGLPPQKVHFVTLGIDADHFAPTPISAAVPGRVFSVGDDRMRDYDTLILALKTVKERRPETTAEIATMLPVELAGDWVTLHRRRMDHAVRACYERAQVVALALRHSVLGSGLTVILEAMASARPIVVTDNPGLSDYVEDGVTGLLVPAGDPEAMADAVERLLADPAAAAEMGREGRRRVEQRFTTGHMARDIDAVLRAVVGTSTSA